MARGVAKVRVTDQVIRNAAIWSDAVRQSRNVLHYRAESALPNTYENGRAPTAGGQPASAGHLRRAPSCSSRRARVTDPDL
jgi:hypothetical protein